jgi:hypothetical protein
MRDATAAVSSDTSQTIVHGGTEIT